MKVTIKQNKMGHILVWKGDPIDKNDLEADLYIQSEADVEAMIEHVGEDIANEIKHGWTYVGADIDDTWFPDNE